MIKFGKNQVGQLCGAAPAEGNTPPAEGAEGNTPPAEGNTPPAEGGNRYKKRKRKTYKKQKEEAAENPVAVENKNQNTDAQNDANLVI